MPPDQAMEIMLPTCSLEEQHEITAAPVEIFKSPGALDCDSQLNEISRMPLNHSQMTELLMN